MKIAIDVLPIRPDGSAGGATGVAMELIKGLVSRQGIQVLVLCGEWNIEYLKKSLPSSVKFCQVMGERRLTGIGIVDKIINSIYQKKHSKSILIENGVDMLYCPFSAATYKEKGIPAVSTIHDIQHEYYPQFFEPQELAHRRRFYQDIVKKVEMVACVSDYTRETFCDKYGFPIAHARTIYNAIQNRFSKEDETILDRLNIRNQNYIVYPANFWEHKNHKLLLNAFAMYSHQKKDLKLVLTGNPLEQAWYYNELLKAMNIADNTVITGYVNDEELYSILKNAKGLIYPSLFEGFGIPVVEAMHLHKLIACSNLTSLPEIGCDSICYFNPKKPDDILRGIRYLAENSVTDDMIREYDEKLRDYEADKMVEAYIKIFEDTINGKSFLTFKEEISGIYPDRWSESDISIQLKDKEGGKVKIRVSLPEFVRIKEKIVLNNNGGIRQIYLKPGDTVELEEEIVDNCCSIMLHMSKTWSPSAILKSEDIRKLGVMVECLQLEMNGETTDLLKWGGI